MVAYLSWDRSTGSDRTMELYTIRTYAYENRREKLSKEKRTCSQTVVILHSFPLSLSTLPVVFSWWLCVILHWEILIANTCIRLAQARHCSKSFTCIESFNEMEAIRQKLPVLYNAESTERIPFSLGWSPFFNITRDKTL